MKKVVSFSLIVILIVLSCTKQASKFPQGAWQLLQVQNEINGKKEVTFPVATMTGSQIKMWSEKHWCIIGEWTEDTLKGDIYGGGTYTIDGNQYNETVMYHNGKVYIGKTLKMTLELKNDTLIQIYQPVDSTGRQIEKTSSIEKYTRLK
jgi:hypothetical protein